MQLLRDLHTRRGAGIKPTALEVWAHITTYGATAASTERPPSLHFELQRLCNHVHLIPGLTSRRMS